MSRNFVLLECGHWFRESVPDTFDPERNPVRVCAEYAAGPRPDPHPDRYKRSAQGLALVPVVVYLPDSDLVKVRSLAGGKVAIWQNTCATLTLPTAVWTTVPAPGEGLMWEVRATTIAEARAAVRDEDDAGSTP